MKYRGISNGIELIGSDYDSASLAIASEHLLNDILALKIDDDNYVFINDNNIDYCSVLGSKGLGKPIKSLLHAPFWVFGGRVGILGSSAITAAMGGSGKREVVFIKLIDGMRILLKVNDGYRHLIHCKRKINKNMIGYDDLEWIRYNLELHPVYL